MMQQYRCTGSCHGTMVGGPCSCGQIFYGHQNNSFSMFFSTPNTAAASHQPYDEADMYSVDCTLSLGTPSTRLSNDGSNHEKSKRRSTNSCVSNFCWDILQQSKHSSTSSHHKSGRGGGANYNSGGETLLSRRCANCDTTSTPLWRNGPKGPKSLCNACGIRFKKEEKRASATATATASSNGGAPAGAGVYGAQNISSKYGINEFRFNIDGGDDDHYHHHHYRDSTDTTGIPFFSSWRLNVHEFTI